MISVLRFCWIKCFCFSFIVEYCFGNYSILVCQVFFVCVVFVVVFSSTMKISFYYFYLSLVVLRSQSIIIISLKRNVFFLLDGFMIFFSPDLGVSAISQCWFCLYSFCLSFAMLLESMASGPLFGKILSYCLSIYYFTSATGFLYFLLETHICNSDIIYV